VDSIRDIDSPQNPVVKAAAKLRKRRGRDQQQRLIIDGQREVQRAQQSGVVLDKVFLPAIANIDRTDLDSFNADLFRLSERAFEKIAFGNRSRIVATAHIPDRKLEDIVLRENATIAVLQGIEKPGNIGAVMRTADGAGIDAVIVVEAITDLFNPNAIRASLGTIFSLQVATASFDEYTDWSSARGLLHYLAKCEEAVHYTLVDYRQACAIVFGSEANGLQDRCDNLNSATSIAVPMLGLADSLNVSAAAAVLFYEAHRQRGPD